MCERIPQAASTPHRATLYQYTRVTSAFHPLRSPKRLSRLLHRRCRTVGGSRLFENYSSALESTASCTHGQTSASLIKHAPPVYTVARKTKASKRTSKPSRHSTLLPTPLSPKGTRKQRQGYICSHKAKAAPLMLSGKNFL